MERHGGSAKGTRAEKVWDRSEYQHGQGFLAFIAMVINCAMEIQVKSERIKMLLDTARRFLNVGDISGEDLDVTLRGGFAPTQTSASGL